jgi:uncharacterized repeat protein (TIGR03809 family)
MCLPDSFSGPGHCRPGIADRHPQWRWLLFAFARSSCPAVAGCAKTPNKISNKHPAIAIAMTVTTLKLRDYQVSRWRKLAEQRLEHVTELFVSGRWRRYFEEPDFLEIVRQTKDAVATWRRLEAPPIETPLPLRATLSFIDEDKQREKPKVSGSVREPQILGLLAPHVRLDKFLEEPEPVSVAAVTNLRPAMRLPSPFQDAAGETALQRAARL